MCVTPGQLPSGQPIPCRKCWQCRENAIQDWVGRCIAQSKTSDVTVAVTLTYGGGDHARATVLTYSDVQKYFKLLRRHGYKFKFLICGEYGSEKGRAHWHAILFFDGKVPKHVIRQNFQCEYWPHGFSFWDQPSINAVRYVCKYIRKDADDKAAQGLFAMSKRPPIGAEYFEKLAQAYVDQGISPQDLRYSFPENRDKEGRPIMHYMHGVTAKDFLNAFLRRWTAQRPSELWPNSELVEEHLDKLASYAPDPVLADRMYGRAPKYPPSETAIVTFDEPANAYRALDKGEEWWFRPTDPNDLKGEYAWRRKTDGKIIRYQDSERFRELSKRRDSAHELLSRSRQAWQARRGEDTKTLSVPRLDRLPMVGDRRLLQAHREAQHRWAQLDGLA